MSVPPQYLRREGSYTNDVGVVADPPEKPPQLEIDAEPYREPGASSQALQSYSPSSRSARSVPNYYSPLTSSSTPSLPNYPQSSFGGSQSNFVSPIEQPERKPTPSLPKYPQPGHSPHSNYASPVEQPERKPITRITIPTRNDALSSGFPYDPRVYELISHDEWHLFSSDVVHSSKVSVLEDFAAWTTGVTTGTLSSPLTLVFAPFVGYYAGRAIHRKTVVNKVKERLERDGDIRSVLQRWNDTKFIPRGFQCWLELPVDGSEINIDAITGKTLSKPEKKVQKQIAKRFKIVVIPNSMVRGWAEEATSETALTTYRSHIDIEAQSPDQTPVEVPGNEFRDPQELQSQSSARGGMFTAARRKQVPDESESDEGGRRKALQGSQTFPVELDGSEIRRRGSLDKSDFF